MSDQRISQEQETVWRRQIRDRQDFVKAYAFVESTDELLNLLVQVYWEGYEAGQGAADDDDTLRAEFLKGRDAGIADAIEALERM